MCLKDRPDAISDSATTSPPERRRLVRARVATSLLTIITGMISGSWSSRAPDIRRWVGADDVAWGLANSVSSVGTVAGMAVVLVLVGRVRIRRLAMLGTWALLIIAPVVATVPSAAFLGGGLAAWAFISQLRETPVWVTQLEVERMYGRPLLGMFIACYSAGNFGGSGLGVLGAAIGLPPWLQLTGISIASGILLLLTWRWLPDDRKDVVDRSPNLRQILARFTPQLLLLAAMRFFTIFMAVAAAQWAAIYASDTTSGGPIIGAAAYAGMSVANAFALAASGSIMVRIGRLRHLRISVTVAAVGLGAALALGTPVAAIMGFVVVGLGTAAIDPIVYGAAGDQPGLSAGEGVSVVEAGELPAGFVSAVMIGLLAGSFGLRLSLGTVVVALLAIALLSYCLRAPDSWSAAPQSSGPSADS